MNNFHNHNLKRRFNKNNKGIGSDVIDWSITGKEETYDENLKTMKEEYPQYQWGDGPDYDDYAKGYLADEAEKLGLSLNNYNAEKKAERLEKENKRLRKKIVKDKTLKLVNENKPPNIEEFLSTIEADIHQTHIIINAKPGHGKSSLMKNIINELKQRDPHLIVKVFDVSFAWFDDAPLPYRQRVTPDTWIHVYNQDNCVYEMGDLSEDTRRLFVSLIIKQDYTIRRKIRELYGEGGLKRMPFIVYVFEEADTYFDSSSLNKKDDASATLRDFIKVGRNFGLRAFCIITTCMGEIGTKLRRRSEHLIGRILSDGDQRMYNRRGDKLGDRAMGLERFNWIYLSEGKEIGPLNLGYNEYSAPQEKPIIKEGVADIKIKLEDRHTQSQDQGQGIPLILRLIGFLLMVALIVITVLK